MSDGFFTPPTHNPPRELLATKYVALADFARDVADGTVKGYTELSFEERRRRFGSSVVPIFVPLAPGETKEQYEARFAAWVERMYDCSLRDLKADGDAQRERYYRMRFSTQNAHGGVRFDPRDFDADGTYCPRGQSPRRRSRSRSEHRDDRYRRSRSSERRSSRDSQSREAGRSEERQRHRSPSPARSTASSSGRQRHTRHPTTGERIPREALYVKKFVELEDYIRDFRHYKIAQYSKLPDAKKLELFGSTIVPIHVPLARGESARQYEERFVQWLETRRRMTLRDLENHDDETLERHLRIKFANLNATGEEAFVPPEGKRERRDDDKSPRPTKRPALSENPPYQKTVEASSREGARKNALSSASSAQSPVCSFSMPPQGALASAVAAAYIACGCRLCLVSVTRFLTTKVAELSGSTCKTCHGKSVAVNKPLGDVVDLTQDNDPQSPKSKSEDASRFAAAVTELVTSETIMNDLQQQLTTKYAKNGDSIVLSNDPVEKQLVAEYEQLNQSVMKLERALGDVTAQLTQTPVTDTTETTRIQDAIQKQRERLDRDSKNRNAALAMVIAHVWRHKRDDLERRLANPQNKNDPHSQRTSHEKCSELTTAIKVTEQNLAKIMQQVDKAMTASPTIAANDSRLVSLTRLGRALTKAEHELRGHLLQRRHELTRLLEYDEHLRVLAQTLMARSR